MEPDRFSRLPTVLDRTGLSRATLYRKVQAGTFPAPIKIARRCAGWRESDVDAWFKNPIYFTVAEDLPDNGSASGITIETRGCDTASMRRE